MSEPAPIRVEVPTLWVGGEDLQTIKINQVIAQVDNAGDIFLTFGTVTPPVLLGDNQEDLQKQAEAIGYVPIKTVSRFALSAHHLREFIDVLSRTAKQADERESSK